MDRRYVMLAAGAGVLGFGGYALLRPGAQVEQNGLLLPMGGAANAQTPPADGAPFEVAEMVIGSADAPVEVIEYVSFTCPHCRRFHEDVLPQIKANYVDSGQVRFVLREVYFDRPGLWAAMVARCAGQDRYFGMVDIIFAEQATWTQGSPAQISENLRQIGRRAGLSDERFDACMMDLGMAQAMVNTYEAHMQEHSISGTPSFVIDGQTYSNMSYDDFAAILDERIAAAQ
jgi:protein-disulfide isomerase